MTEMGKASGVFNMGRFLGGMFGVAGLVAVFSAVGSIDTPATFSTGFAAAMRVAAALSLLGAIAGLWLPTRLRVPLAAAGIHGPERQISDGKREGGPVGSTSHGSKGR